MSVERKARGDAVLKTLPEERQGAIAEHADSHRLAETRGWLSADGIRISCTALSNFLSWYHLRRQFQSFSADTATFVQMLKKQRPDLAESELRSYANLFFQVQAVKQEDPKTYLAFASARHRAEMDRLKYDQKERELALAQAKFQRETTELFIKWHADQRAAEIAGGAMSNSDKIEQLGKLMFGDIWKPEVAA